MSGTAAAAIAVAPADGLKSNRAGDLGRKRFPWWPDWRGEYVALIASGPSAKEAKLDVLRGRVHVAVVKQNIDLCPWADVVYGCDDPWWMHRRGLPEYQGLKFAYGSRACDQFKDVKRVTIKNPKDDRLLLDEPLAIGSGGNSGFQLMNLVVQFGVTGILLVGFDMHQLSGAHWYGRNTWQGANNPDESNFMRWTRAFAAVGQELARGIDVVNASATSALTSFPKASIEATLERWGL